MEGKKIYNKIILGKKNNDNGPDEKNMRIAALEEVVYSGLIKRVDRIEEVLIKIQQDIELIKQRLPEAPKGQSPGTDPK